jgi:pimeloyl-ACP methyl ester carboxylesterase
MTKLFGEFSGRRNIPESPAPGSPLVIAIHGGTYSSAYFDIPGFSLIDRAAANAMPIIAIDRPGYGSTPLLPPDQTTIKGQAVYIERALEEAWRIYGQGRSGIVLIGHSIGAAIAAAIASGNDGLPIIGLAISGVGLRTPPGDLERWSALPEIPLVEMPTEIKNLVMFGPEGSFDPEAPSATDAANAPANRGELIDIVSTWQIDVHGVLTRIKVPVHYRQGEFDKLWIVDQNEVDGFAAAVTGAPRIDAQMIRDTGHCIDFHNVGAAFQLQQLGFALQCGAEA